MCIQPLGSRWTDFLDILNIGMESKTCSEIQIYLNVDKKEVALYMKVYQNLYLFGYLLYDLFFGYRRDSGH
jgi:hypothetical protein